MSNTYDAERHIYRAASGRLPGATDVIRSQHLVDPDWFTDDARWRGKAVHRGIELINKGTLDWETVDETVAGYLRSYEQFLVTSGFEVAGSEEPCFEAAFACMPDLWGALNGGLSIVELKTGAVPKWAALQTALQKRALATHHGFHAVKRFGLQLLADGKLAKLMPFEDPRDEYRAMEAVDLFHWKLDNGYMRDWQKGETNDD